MKYIIIPIQLAYGYSDKSTLVAGYSKGEICRMAYGAFVIQDKRGEAILFDTGIPKSGIIGDDKWPNAKLENVLYFIEELRKRKINPMSIRKIVLSHLHWDHSWNLQMFPNAEIYLQRKELLYAVEPEATDRRPYGMRREDKMPHWAWGLGRMKLIDGNENINAGLRILATPGHTPGSQSLLVDTLAGKYVLVGDCFYCEENWKEKRPIGTIMDINAWYRSYDIIKGCNAIPLSTHEPAVYEKEVYGIN